MVGRARSRRASAGAAGKGQRAQQRAHDHRETTPLAQCREVPPSPHPKRQHRTGSHTERAQQRSHGADLGLLHEPGEERADQGDQRGSGQQRWCQPKQAVLHLPDAAQLTRCKEQRNGQFHGCERPDGPARARDSCERRAARCPERPRHFSGTRYCRFRSGAFRPGGSRPLHRRLTLPISARASGAETEIVPFFRIGFICAYDLVGVLFVRIEVREQHDGAKAHAITGKLRGVDHLGPRQFVFDVFDSGFVQALLLFAAWYSRFPSNRRDRGPQPMAREIFGRSSLRRTSSSRSFCAPAGVMGTGSFMLPRRASLPVVSRGASLDLAPRAGSRAAAEPRKAGKWAAVNLRPKRNAASRASNMRTTKASARGSSILGQRRVTARATPGLLLGLALASSALLGCEKEYRPVSAFDYSEKAKRDYDAAMDDFDAKNWESARQKLAEVKRSYGYSRYARLAELRLADADYEQDKFAEATAGYKAFVHDYPERSRNPVRSLQSDDDAVRRGELVVSAAAARRARSSVRERRAQPAFARFLND